MFVRARNPLRIAVLLGGNSSERMISLESGRSIAAALRDQGYETTLMDPAEMDLELIEWSSFDLAFIALHGQFGEDGEVQSLLDQAGVPYTSSPAAVCELTFRKSKTKACLQQLGIPTPPYRLVHAMDSRAQIEAAAAEIGFPLVVKPDAQGSSFGISIVRTLRDLPAALERCFEFGSVGMLESYIEGREFTAGFVGEFALPVIQIETVRGFFDYQAKYEDSGTCYRFDFEAGSDELSRIEDVCRASVEGLGLQGISRIDLRVDGTGNPWVLEANSVPGFTDHSLVPMAAREIGWNMVTLCEQAIACSLHQVVTS